MSELVGTQKAAALHGVAINRAYSQADRLAAAIQALDIYEQEYDTLAAHEPVEKLYEAALNARQSITTSNKHLRLRMEHYLEADCGCIAVLTGNSILNVRDEVERRYHAADEAAWLTKQAPSDRRRLHGPVPIVDITDEKAKELDRVLEEHVQAYDEEMNRSPFPEEAWDEIFSTVPDYPTNLPDDVIRYIADLAIHVRELAANLEAGLGSGNRLTTLMGLSLISGSMKRIEAFVAGKFERGDF